MILLAASSSFSSSNLTQLSKSCSQLPQSNVSPFTKYCCEERDKKKRTKIELGQVDTHQDFLDNFPKTFKLNCCNFENFIEILTHMKSSFD
jgi:hypothetical protein